MDSRVEALLEQGVAEIIDRQKLAKLLTSGKKLKIKLGVDPTSVELHLGHGVVLRKLRQFQDLGHQVILLIGDFTAMIGDPAGVKKTRPALSTAEVKKNMSSYTKQIEIIFGKKPPRIVYNSHWLKKMALDDFIKYSQLLTLNNLIERKDFRQRLEAGESVGAHELIYPILQGLDSIQLKADVEIGGNDQRLNLLMAQDLQRRVGQEPQQIMMLKELIGLDGQLKMSSSKDNFIPLTASASEMFGQLMRIDDKQISSYAELAAGMTKEQIDSLPTHPREAKAQVARRTVACYWGDEAATQARKSFEALVSGEETPDELVKPLKIPVAQVALDGVVSQAANCSMSQARRLIFQKAVSLNGEVIEDAKWRVDVNKDRGKVLRLGPRRIFRLE